MKTRHQESQSFSDWAQYTGILPYLLLHRDADYNPGQSVLESASENIAHVGDSVGVVAQGVTNVVGGVVKSAETTVQILTFLPYAIIGGVLFLLGTKGGREGVGSVASIASQFRK